MRAHVIVKMELELVTHDGSSCIDMKYFRSHVTLSHKKKSESVLLGQSCFARWCLFASSVVGVCNTAGGWAADTPRRANTVTSR